MRLFVGAIALGAAAIFAAITPAGAADMYDGAPLPVRTPAPDWSGFYFGINGGYGWALADHLPGPTSGTGINDLNLRGWFAGGQLGVNWQMPEGTVFGIEGDLQWSGIRGSCVAGVCGGGGPPATSQTIDWFGTVRARLGFATGDMMPYITGGWAFGQGTRTTAALGGSTFTASHSGWALGGGVEWMVAPEWSMKAEYQYLDLGSQTYAFPIGGFDPIVNLTAHTARVGLNRHF